MIIFANVPYLITGGTRVGMIRILAGRSEKLNQPIG